MFFPHCVEPESNGSVNANGKVVVHDVDWNIVIFNVIIITIARRWIGIELDIKAPSIHLYDVAIFDLFQYHPHIFPFIA